MDCPFCRVSSMAQVMSGGREVDRCLACGALWFDYGEIRELTDGRLGVAVGFAAADPGSPSQAPARPGAVLSRMRREAASMKCPRCGGTISAADFQMTGIPLYRCLDCRGVLAPRAAAAAISERFRVLRESGAKLAALGETLASAERARMEEALGPALPALGRRGAGGGLPLPVVLPLSDDAPALGSVPLVTLALIGVSAVLYLIGKAATAPLALPGGLAGLPAGTGFFGVSRLALLAYPFFHAGIVPLLAGALFLYVFGDNVEDRMGSIRYLILYLFCGAVAGAVHVLWGESGAPPALGSGGAVAGVLGAYLVFFPDVSIRMYGMGRVVSIPAYLFACAWVVAVFLSRAGSGPLESFFDPMPLSLPGSLAGFAAGALAAAVFRSVEPFMNS